MKMQHGNAVRIAKSRASREGKPNVHESTDISIAELVDDGYVSSDGSCTIIKKQAPPQSQGASVQPSPTNSNPSKTTINSSRIRPISYPPAMNNLIDSNEQSTRQLRALLLPDLVRAKGGRLISTSEIASLQRVRSISDPTGFSSASSQAQGYDHGPGHRRTFSLPGSRYFNPSVEVQDEMVLKKDVSPDCHYQEGGSPDMPIRKFEMNTFDEPYDLVKNFDEFEMFNSPMAGYTHSFRDYMYDGIADCGSGTKPLVIVFRHDPFFSLALSSSFSSVRTMKEGAEYEDGDGEGHEDVRIEAWSVDVNGSEYSRTSTYSYSTMEYYDEEDAEHASFDELMDGMMIDD